MNPIVNPSIFAAPTAPAAPADPVQATLTAAIAQLSTHLARDMSLFYRLSAYIWNNPQGKTPQQMFNYLGAQAASLVALSNAWTTFVQATSGETIAVVPAGSKLTINADGTATVV